jgi:hypothetical protein
LAVGFRITVYVIGTNKVRWLGWILRIEKNFPFNAGTRIGNAKCKVMPTAKFYKIIF